jgi:hypothetical protein
MVQPTIYYSSTPSLVDKLFLFIGNILSAIFSFGFLGLLYVVLAILVIGTITLIFFLLVRMYEIRQEDEHKNKAMVVPATMLSGSTGSALDPNAPVENQTWKHIRERLLSDNTSDWKLAIIEGDIYMDRVLDDKGFHGDTTSDKLKQVTPDKLPSVQLAWEVHLIRNRIAHQGAAFVLTMPEARRLLSSYQIIFTDLGVL